MKINYSKDKMLSEFSKKTLIDRYMIEGERSPQDAFMRAAQAFADDDAHAERLYGYASNLWFMFATPLLSNGGTTRGLPISCFLNYVDDSLGGLANHFEENVFLTAKGGGIGSYFGGVRELNATVGSQGKSLGVIPHIKVEDSQMIAYAQGSTRRGSSCVYLDIDHPEIEEFLDIRKPTGDMSRRCPNIHHAVILNNDFIDKIKQREIDPNFDDSFDLISPSSGKVTKTMPARTLWVKILQNRMELGEPFIVFKEKTQDALPKHLKDKGLTVNHSNLCTEITLPTNKDRTAVCCLSSVNLEEFSQWKDDEMFIPDLMRMLDNALQVFIDTAPPEMHKAVLSAKSERSVGLGAMGFHAFLQRHDIAFEGLAAKAANRRMFEHISSEAKRADDILMYERGPCPDSEGTETECRFSHRLAIAPNASSSIICDNTSPSIEPYRANIYNQKTMSGTSTFKNPYLEYALQETGHNNEDVWKSILENKGSVQHLDFLTDNQKDIFKTAVEIDQFWLLEHANDRQQFICQAQSLNLFLSPDVQKQYLHKLHLKAATSDYIKTLYYLRSEALNRAENTTYKVDRYDFNLNEDECLACEG